MAVNRRLLVASLVVAASVSVAGGWALSQAGDDTTTDTTTGATTGRSAAGSDDSVVDLGSPTVAQIPAISTNAALSGESLPDVTLVDNDGNEVRTTDLLGEPLVLNLWFSTCVPCKRELPEFAVVHGELGDRIRFVGVNPLDTAETNESFARERGVQYELLRDPDGAFTAELGVANFPVTLFVAADGTIVRQTGVLDGATLREYAEELLP